MALCFRVQSPVVGSQELSWKAAAGEGGSLHNTLFLVRQIGGKMGKKENSPFSKICLALVTLNFILKCFRIPGDFIF